MLSIKAQGRYHTLPRNGCSMNGGNFGGTDSRFLCRRLVGADTEVLARAKSLDIASAAYMAAVARYRLRNVQLRHGGRIVRRYEGEPVPVPPPDPNLRRWSAHLIGGKRMTLLGYVEAVAEPAAIAAAVAMFALDDHKQGGWQ